MRPIPDSTFQIPTGHLKFGIWNPESVPEEKR